MENVGKRSVLLIGFLCGCANGNGGNASAPDLANVGDLAPERSDMADVDLAGSGGDMTTDICAMIVDTGTVVQQVVVAQPMPTPTMGGTIAPGTYHLTDSKIYQGAPPGISPVQLKATQVISPTAIQAVQDIVGATNSLYSTRTYTTAGTTLTVTATCGATGSATLGYDATATQYTSYNDAAKTVNVWTKL